MSERLRRRASDYETVTAGTGALPAANDSAPPLFRFGSGEANAAKGDVRVKMTPRECEVLQSLAEGLSAKEVAQRLNMAPKTVECHIERVRLKTNAKNRLQMVVIALRAGLIQVRS